MGLLLSIAGATTPLPLRFRMKAAQRVRLFNDVFARDQGRCVYCGIPARRPGLGVKRGPDLATLDHVVPKSLGGPLSRDNIALACSACNNERGTMDAQVFKALKAGRAK